MNKKKNSIVCFRLSKDLHESLLRMAKEERRSLSSLIELILTNHAKEWNLLEGTKNERRQYQRKSILAPALIKRQNCKEVEFDSGTINDISLGGVQVTLPGDVKWETPVDRQPLKFEIVFSLGSASRPLSITCESLRRVDSDEGIRIGASFIDADLRSYQLLQSYLI